MVGRRVRGIGCVARACLHVALCCWDVVGGDVFVLEFEVETFPALFCIRYTPLYQIIYGTRQYIDTMALSWKCNQELCQPELHFSISRE